MSDDLVFEAEDEKQEESTDSQKEPWKVMIIDDEKAVHQATRLALDDFSFEDRTLDLISGYSGVDAKKLIVDHPDTAMMLLDVVMESEQAGLEVARYIRGAADNPFVRIILRTGQPGQAPEQKVIADYDINDYKEKAELTAEKLITVTTASLRAYRDLRMMEKLAGIAEAANQAKTEFLGNVSEELRRPMREIIGATSQGLNDIDAYAKEKMQRYCASVQVNSLQLLALVNDINTFAKLEAGQMEYDRQEHDLLKTVEAVAKELNVLLETRSLRLEIVPPACGTLAYFDAESLFQVLHNLLFNTVKFAPDSKTIAVTCATASLKQEKGTAVSALALSIKDDGVGIPENELESIFDRFVCSSRNEVKQNCTGLGLSIAREIISAHGGTIRAENNTDGGAIFTLTIPISSES